MSESSSDPSSYVLREDLAFRRLTLDTGRGFFSDETKGYVDSPRSRKSFRVAKDIIDADTRYSPADSNARFQDAADRLELLPNYVKLLQNPSRNPFERLPFNAPLPPDFYNFMLKKYKETDHDDGEAGESDDAQGLLTERPLIPKEDLSELEGGEELMDEKKPEQTEDKKKALLLEKRREEQQCEILRERIALVSSPQKKRRSEKEIQRLNKIKLKASINYLAYFQNDMTHLKAYLESLEEVLREFFPRHELRGGVKKKDYGPDDFEHHESAYKILRAKKAATLSDRKQKNQLFKYYIELCETHHTLNYVYRLLCFHKGRAIDYQNVFMQGDFDDPNQAVAYRYSHTLRCKVGGPSETFLLRAFRKNHFPLLNVIRLTFLVRIENVIDKFALLIGSPISQNLYIHMVDAFSWTQFLGWVFYLPRMITNISIAIHNARRSSAFNQVGLTLWKKIQRFFSMLWHNTSERKWQQFNDFAWAIIGLCTCFIPSASALTPLLYLYDIFVAVSQHLQTVHMWDSRRRYAASLCDNYDRGFITENDAIASIGEDPIFNNLYQDKAPNTFGLAKSVKGFVDLDKNKEKPISAERVDFYLTRLNLIRLYQHMCDQVLSVNNDGVVRDCSVWSVPELHRRALSAWTFHVSGVIALMDENAKGVQQEMRRVYHSVKAFSFALPLHITKEMKLSLKKANTHFSRLNLKNIANSHPALRRYFSAMTKGYRSAKTALVRDAIVTTCLALGMIGGFLGSGSSVFGLVSMPSIPLLAVISLGAVFLTSLSSLVMNRTGTPTIRIKGA